MPEAPQRRAHVAGQRPDIGALAGLDFENAVIAVLLPNQLQAVDIECRPTRTEELAKRATKL